MTKPKPNASILIIDDHPLIREALEAALQKNWPAMKIQCAASLEDALVQIATLPTIDLAFLDLTMPGHHGLSALWTLRERCPALPIVIFSAHCAPETIRSALASGARGFIPKHCSSDLIHHALRLILDGGVYVPIDALSTVEPHAGVSESAPQFPDPMGLPRRQREIVELVARGLSNKEICRQLNISPNTVKTHLSMIFDTLAVHSRYEIFALMHNAAAGREGRASG